jgi:pyruvate/2-oxoacid:ferredoxin oxidoreductase beta subunit
MPKSEPKKDIVPILLAHRIPYLATVTVAYPDDFIRKVRKAMDLSGFRFFHILAPCPTGWGFPTGQTLKLSRLAVQTRVFPLFEVEEGSKVTLSKMPRKSIPVGEYLRIQKRFSIQNDCDCERIKSDFQKDIEKKWDWLLKLAT